MSPPHAFGLAGLLGWPVAHSRSPVIHNHWLNEHGIAGRYVLLPVPGENLADALRGMPLLGFRGCNVTMPHKQAVLPFLAHVDPMARRIGAINTIVAQEDGTLSGFNNDGIGYVQSLLDAKPDWRPDAGPILIIGAGGSARAVVVALLEKGAREIRVVNRTAERAQSLAAEFGAAVTAVPWTRRAEAMADVAMVTNATDQGLKGKPALDVALDRLPGTALVGDLIYTPPETPFLAAARERGNVTVNGLGLLLNQARLAFRMWFGVLPEVTPELRKAVEATF